MAGKCVSDSPPKKPGLAPVSRRMSYMSRELLPSPSWVQMGVRAVKSNDVHSVKSQPEAQRTVTPIRGPEGGLHVEGSPLRRQPAASGSPEHAGSRGNSANAACR